MFDIKKYNNYQIKIINFHKLIFILININHIN